MISLDELENKTMTSLQFPDVYVHIPKPETPPPDKDIIEFFKNIMIIYQTKERSKITIPVLKNITDLLDISATGSVDDVIIRIKNKLKK